MIAETLKHWLKIARRQTAALLAALVRRIVPAEAELAEDPAVAALRRRFPGAPTPWLEVIVARAPHLAAAGLSRATEVPATGEVGPAPPSPPAPLPMHAAPRREVPPPRAYAPSRRNDGASPMPVSPHRSVVASPLRFLPERRREEPLPMPPPGVAPPRGGAVPVPTFRPRLRVAPGTTAAPAGAAAASRAAEAPQPPTAPPADRVASRTPAPQPPVNRVPTHWPLPRQAAVAVPVPRHVTAARASDAPPQRRHRSAPEGAPHPLRIERPPPALALPPATDRPWPSLWPPSLPSHHRANSPAPSAVKGAVRERLAWPDQPEAAWPELPPAESFTAPPQGAGSTDDQRERIARLSRDQTEGLWNA